MQVTKPPEHLCGSPIAYFYRITVWSEKLSLRALYACLSIFLCIKQHIYLAKLSCEG